MIQTSFFPQPEKDKPIKIIQIDPSGLQPRKMEELLPNHNILLDTYIIYPTGGYHPFYGVLNTFPRYQLPIWPYVKRIKYSDYHIMRGTLNEARRFNLRDNTTLEQINPWLYEGYFKVSFILGAKQFVHRLVALAWIPNPKKKKNVCHINDDRTNFLPENLKWGTTKENSQATAQRLPDTMEHKYLNCVLKGYVKG